MKSEYWILYQIEATNMDKTLLFLSIIISGVLLEPSLGSPTEPAWISSLTAEHPEANYKKIAKEAESIEETRVECRENPDKCPDGPSTQVLACLENCANCVKQWRDDVYNGKNCADDCVMQQEGAKESVDLDCNSLKYFNRTLLGSDTP